MTWEIVHNAELERVRRMPVPGGWLYQTELDGWSESAAHGVAGEYHRGWYPPVFVPDAAPVAAQHNDLVAELRYEVRALYAALVARTARLSYWESVETDEGELARSRAVLVRLGVLEDRRTEPLTEDETATPATGCPVHYGAVHGGEAEELRKGIEQLIENQHDCEDITGLRAEMQRLLDRVDARDSLAHVEMTPALTDTDRIHLRRMLDASELAERCNEGPEARYCAAESALLRRLLGGQP